MIPLQEFVHRLRMVLNGRVAEHIEPLVACGAHTYDEYTRHCGLIKGLQIAREELDELVKRVNDGRE